ncbi:MAG: pilin [Candidatus Scatovivens sp.]
MAKRRKRIFNLIVIITLVSIFLSLIYTTSFAVGTDGVGNIDGNTIGAATKTGKEDDTTESDTGLMGIIKKTVAQWYYVFRYFSIIAMLLVLIYLGIKMAISSIAEEQAKYKRMIADWVVGFIIIFCIHYFMVFVLKLNQICLDAISDLSTNLTDKLLTDNENGLTGAGLYETIRTRAYEFRAGIGTSGMIMYMVLVYYTFRFILIYFKRFFTILILTITAPLAALSYAFTKVNTGKAPILSKWAQEYTFNVFLQTIHALLYGCFVSIALALSTESIAGFIIALIMLNFMLKADKIFRKIFKFSGKLLEGNDNSDIKQNFAALTAMKASVSTFVSSAMIKDFSSSVKRKVGAVSNVGLYAGLSAYDKVLTKNDDKLNDKKEESEKLEKQINDTERREQRDSLIKKKMKLDSKIAAMEGRRNRLKRYKGTNVSKTNLGKELNNRNIEKRANAIIEKEKEKGPVSEKRKNEIRKQVAKEYNNRIKRRTVEFNKITGKYEVTSGIAKQLKGDFNRAIWGNSEIKGATQSMIKNTLKGISGSAMIFVAIPQIVANPKIGLPLLAKGINNAKKLYGNNGYKDVTTAGYRRKIKNVQRKNKKYINQREKNKKAEYKKQKYSFSRFNPKSLDTIKAQMKMDMNTNFIRNINTPSLGLKILTTPLRLTGILGATRNIQSYAYKVNEAKKDRYEQIETAFAIEKKESMSKDFIYAYNKKVSAIEGKEREKLSRRNTRRYANQA